MRGFINRNTSPEFGPCHNELQSLDVSTATVCDIFRRLEIVTVTCGFRLWLDSLLELPSAHSFSWGRGSPFAWFITWVIIALFTLMKEPHTIVGETLKLFQCFFYCLCPWSLRTIVGILREEKYISCITCMGFFSKIFCSLFKKVVTILKFKVLSIARHYFVLSTHML